VLYISHNSVGTALVRGQVLTYLRGLSADGIETDLLTYERGGPFPTGEFPRGRWHPIQARSGSSVVVKALDVLGGALLGVRVIASRRVRFTHARGYVPAALAAVLRLFTGRPYIFDMRGFLGEEYVDAGYWKPTELRFRLLRISERWLLRHAAHIVVLTHTAAARLRADPLYSESARGKPVTVIPCAVDLERFRPRDDRASVPTVVHSGSLGIAYDLPGMLRLYARARALRPDLRLLFLNRDAHDTIAAARTAAGLDDADIVIRSASFDEMPSLVGACHVGIICAFEAPSKSGSSPVKVGEYLACGLPVVSTPNLGDTDTLLARYDAGAIVRVDDDLAVDVAARALVGLLDDELRRRNARRLAETEFALESGVALYREVYRRMAGSI
jgi:glycosyltransferase involved in cell wall biosynthesis